MLKNNKGVTLISLIIVIIATIILASMVMFSGEETPDAAIFARFEEETSNIRTSLGIIRNSNLLEYNDANNGFAKVTVENAPDRFISFEEGSDVGYLIEMDKIGMNEIKRGRDSITDGVVTFDEDDVYIYDKNGTVFHVLGFEFDGKIYYNSSSYKEF